MNTHYTFTFLNKDDYKHAKKHLTYTSYNDKLKELYVNNHNKYTQILNDVKTLSYSFILQGVQRIDDVSSILFIIKSEQELSYKAIEVTAESSDSYDIAEENALIHLLDLPFNIM